MPMKLNVGLSRKVGEPNYGSRGASVNLELELDNSLVEQPERLRDRIRQLYQLAKASVDEELHGTGQQPVANNNHGDDHNNGQGGGLDQYRVSNRDKGNGNGQRQPANGHGRRPVPRSKPFTPSRVETASTWGSWCRIASTCSVPRTCRSLIPAR
jgi:hypothetical protein